MQIRDVVDGIAWQDLRDFIPPRMGEWSDLVGSPAAVGVRQRRMSIIHF
ncbi:hypothetical protein BM716_000230 [Escherichia coli]|nr:hypothetical protein [Escherichia coli]